MERWRNIALATLMSVVFLAGLLVVAEAGRTRLRAASEDMQSAMSRRILLAEFREHVTGSALAYRSFLATGRPEYLATIGAAGRDVNALAERLVAEFKDEEPGAGLAARQLRYLAGVQAGAMMSVIALYRTSGLEAARELAHAQNPATDPVVQLLNTGEQLERLEDSRVQGTHANWQREVSAVQWLAAAGTAVNVLVVLCAALLAATTLRRHRLGIEQVARRKDELEIEAATQAAELNEVYGYLQSVEEQERSRLARGLHDELGGLLLAARMDVSWLRHHADSSTTEPDALRARVARLLDVLDQGIDLKRRMIEQLRPTLLDNVGLLAAIRWQVEETCGRAGLEHECIVPPAEPQVSSDVAIALFRVLQEALENTQRHAAARHVLVRLEATPSHYVLSIADDGERGSGGGRAAYEVAAMRHRMNAVGGSLWAGPVPAGGSEVRAVAPRLAVESQGAGTGAPQRDDLAEARNVRSRRESGH
jgi:signal transduction histidine kinase